MGLSARYDVLSREASGHHRPGRENRINVGSVFSNESSNISIGAVAGPEPSTTDLNEVFTKEKNNNMPKIQSNENISGDVEHAKHISFAFVPEKDDEVSFDSTTNLHHFEINPDEKNTDRLSSGAVLARNGVASLHEKSSQSSHQPNKRNSLKSPRRPSLKFRGDRSRNSNNNSNASSSNLRRKMSQGTSLSFHATDDKESENFAVSHHQTNEVNETGFLLINQSGSPDPINNSSSSNTQIQSSINPAASNSSSYNENAFNSSAEFCEVDEIDFNRCFPWIKVNT